VGGLAVGVGRTCEPKVTFEGNARADRESDVEVVPREEPR
jgi:hypothetical protein